MVLIDGKKTAQEISAELKEKVEKYVARGYRPPHLVAILVGDDPASTYYVKSKEKKARKAGYTSEIIHLDKNITEEKLLTTVDQLNNDSAVDGFIVQLPLPSQIDEHKILMAIDPEKDIDGFHPQNIGKMIAQLPTFLPATPYGILELIRRYNIPTEGKKAVVIGRSLIVGRPLSILLSQKRPGGNATVCIAHSKTRDIKKLTQDADIVITAIGKPHFLQADMVKEGVVIIDAGINEIPDSTKPKGYKLVGDVDFEQVSKKASYITPVPGGVGPMTIAMLLKNTLQAYENNYLKK
jgi:methylenetetrahydrofolate dehydrogenase (NADP+)/methenyltetrahydrofolate cyclohydrolase